MLVPNTTFPRVDALDLLFAVLLHSPIIIHWIDWKWKWTGNGFHRPLTKNCSGNSNSVESKFEILKRKKSIEMFQIELMLGIGIRHGIGYKRRTLGPIPISRFFSAANQNEWNGIAHCHWSWFYGYKTTANQRPRRKWIARNCHSNSSPFVYPFVIDVRLCYLQWINSIRNSLSSCL